MKERHIEGPIFFQGHFLSTHQTDEKDDGVKPHGPPVNAEHPETVNEEKFHHQGHHRFDYRHVEGGRKWRNEMFYIAVASNEPVIHICAIEYCLYGFEKEYRVHYKKNLSEAERDGSTKRIACREA